MRTLTGCLLCLLLLPVAVASAGDVTELARFRNMTDEQLVEELQRRGLSRQMAEQAAPQLRRQLGPRPKPGFVRQSQHQLTTLTEQATLDDLRSVEPIESTVLHLYDNPADVVRVTLVNSTARNHNAVIDGAFVFTNAPADFALYGVTAGGQVFKASLDTPAATQGKAKRRGSQHRCIAIERKHLPVTIFLHQREVGAPLDPAADGELETKQDATASRDATSSWLSYLKENATLTLEITGAHEPREQDRLGPAPTNAAFAIVGEQTHGYLFAPTAGRQPILERTLRW